MTKQVRPTFEQSIDVIDEEISKRRSRWHLTAISWMDFQDVSQRLRIHIYKKWDKNMGTSYSLNQGVILCNNELIIRMDSDDIMLPKRIQTQINFMKSNIDCVICGTHITCFNSINNNKKILNNLQHAVT